ncbi:hypothetical protein KUTeg_019221, partial [Tegillarca granosa]
MFNISDSETWGSCLLKPSASSGWTSMIAQDGTHSQISLEHAFGEWPAYVDIQIKPANQSGSNAPFVFPGISSAQRDDDENILYGGIVYIYDKTRVTLFAPNRNDGSASGASIFTETGSYIEIRHGLNREPQFVSVQIKLGNTDFISDGIGSDTKLDSSVTNTKWGGVIHAYDNNTVRIWAPNSLGDGEVRVRVWSTLSSAKYAKGNTRIGLKGQNATTINLPFVISQSNDLFKVTLKTTDASNIDFHFLASGAVQNTKPNVPFGALVYAYSDFHLRYWYPLLNEIGSTGKGYIVYLNNRWGDGTSSQLSTTVYLESNAWKTYPTCPPPTTPAAVPHHPDRPLHTAPSWFLKYSFRATNRNGITTATTVTTTNNGTAYNQKASTNTTGS